MRAKQRIGHRIVNSRVKVVHRGTVTMGSGTVTAVGTFPAIVPEHSLVYFLGSSCGGIVTPLTNSFARLWTLTSTTLLVTRADGTETDVITFGWLVVEYWPKVLRGVIRGTINTPATATIAAFDLATAVLSQPGFSNGTDGFDFPRVSLPSNTQVQGHAGNAGATTSYQVHYE